MKTKKLICMLLISVLCLSLTACGEEKQEAKPTITPEEQPTPEAETAPVTEEAATPIPLLNFDEVPVQTWHIYNIHVPEDLDFYGGSDKDPDDTERFTLKNDYGSFEFYTPDPEKQDAEKVVMDKYEALKKEYTNNQAEVSATYGEIVLEGFKYEGKKGKPGFVVHGKHDWGDVLIISRGYDFDNIYSASVISYIEVDPAPDAEEEEYSEETDDGVVTDEEATVE